MTEEDPSINLWETDAQGNVTERKVPLSGPKAHFVALDAKAKAAAEADDLNNQLAYYQRENARLNSTVYTQGRMIAELKEDIRRLRNEDQRRTNRDAWIRDLHRRIASLETRCTELMRMNGRLLRGNNLKREPINVIFDGPPGPESGRFVEVETDNGYSVSVGEWSRDRRETDGKPWWRLRIEPNDLPTQPGSARG